MSQIQPGFIRVVARISSALGVFALAGFLALAGCKASQENAKDKRVSEQTTQEALARKALPLPPFPDLPAPVAQLGATDEGVIYYPTKSPYDFSRLLNGFDSLESHAGMGTLFLPDGAGADNPVPAIIILHGSGGITDGREYEYAELFNGLGIAAFVVDYYSPRGVTAETPYVMKTMIATEVDIMSDAYSALNVLGTHPAVDAGRIGVTGYSYGGMATRYVLDDRLKNIIAPGVPPFALHMDIYGPCHQTLGHTGTTGAPYLAIFGDKDNSVDPEVCKSVYIDLEAGGSKVEYHILEGAGHAWENDAPLAEFPGGYVSGCSFSFAPETGTFLVDGKAGRFQPAPDMNREERAFVRSTLGELVGTCVGQGYLIGNNPVADAKSKALQTEFVKRHFGLD